MWRSGLLLGGLAALAAMTVTGCSSPPGAAPSAAGVKQLGTTTTTLADRNERRGDLGR